MNKLKIILPLAVFLLSFGVYTYTLNPSLSAADSTEIVLTSIVLGIPHQPGYPVNTILGHLFSKIPFGTLPWRVNLMSAFFQAATVVLVYFVIMKLYRMALRSPTAIFSASDSLANKDMLAVNLFVAHKGSTQKSGGLPAPLSPIPYTLYPSYYFLAACAALFLAFSLEFWQFATRAEVFPLNNFFGAALFLIGLLWWEKTQGLGDRVSAFAKASADRQGLGFSEGKKSADSIPYTLHPKPSAVPPRKILQKYSFLAKYLPDEARRRWSAYQPLHGKALRGSQTPSLRFLYLLAFVAGLAFTHHQTIVLLVPALLFLLFTTGVRVWWKKGVLIKLVLCFFLGILPYFSLIPISRANPPSKWGEPNNLKGVFKSLTRSDYGTFSPYAQNPAEIEGQKQKETPISQQVFYFKSLKQDFTVIGLFLAILGIIYLFRCREKIAIYPLLAFLFSGPIFLGYANYTLDSGFHQAVAKRFQMLPNVFFTLFIAFGFFFLWDRFLKLKLDYRQKKNVLVHYLMILLLTSTFLYPVLRNFKYADNRNNTITINYARDALAPTPKNALILVSGDVTIFAFDYWQTLVEGKNDRIIFSPGLLYMDWYVQRLKRSYPEIIMPPTLPGRIQPSTTQIIDANWGKRPIYISPELARYDPEVEKKYVLWPKHLLFLVKKRGDDLRLEPYRAENEALWQTHDLELFEKVRQNNPLLEYAVIPEYARQYFNLGAVFENVHLYDDAIREYERALQIHPGFPDPYKNLGRIYGFELKDKDLQKAWDNFQMFLTTALPSQQEDVKAVQAAMGQLQEEAIREATRSASLEQARSASLKASESGSLATPSSRSSKSAEVTKSAKKK